MPTQNEVIINVYVESRNLRSHQRTDPIKKINPNPFSSKPRVFKTRGYDQRAQLLAYAQELRQAHAHQLQQPFENLRRKPKKCRWAVAMEKMRRLFSRFGGMKRKWEYESIGEENTDGEGSCNQERKKKRRERRRKYSHFCKKLRCLLKEISKVWKCKNGGC